MTYDNGTKTHINNLPFFLAMTTIFQRRVIIDEHFFESNFNFGSGFA